MNKVSIDLLDIHKKQQNPTLQDARSFIFPKTLMAAMSIGFVLVGSTVLSYQASKDASSPISSTWNAFLNFSPLQSLTTGTDKQLQGESEGRINVLILGIGGEKHDGPYLTDTIILASLQPSTNKLALLSIPRDLVVPIPGYGYRKINEVNSFGETQKSGFGAEFSRKTIADFFRTPIPYVVRIDFQGFVNTVDMLGGLEIDVEKAFTDRMYPAPNDKYQPISFKQGSQIMDGETALKFVRSRHSAVASEGSDFARSKRQHKVLSSLKNKLMSASILLNPQKISALLRELNTHVTTNLEGWEAVRLGLMMRTVSEQSTSAAVIDGASGLVYDDVSSDGAYVLRPVDGSYDSIRKRIAEIFADTFVPTPYAMPPGVVRTSREAVQENVADQPTEKTMVQSETIPLKQIENPSLSDLRSDTDIENPIANNELTPNMQPISDAKPPHVTIYNGTFIEGLASRISKNLEQQGFIIDSIGNAAQRNVAKAVIIDQSQGEFSDSLSYLLTTYNASLATESPYPSTSDFIIILGADSAQVARQ